MTGEHDQPLAGLRVLDFSLLLPGPVCSARLAWFGAEVVKVEPPGGDPARELYGGSLWELFNRGKRSLAIDLKDVGERQRLLALIPSVDVIVEGFRPGVMRRLGVDYERVRDIRDDVVYCSITGFGEDEDRDRPGHDLIFMAESGALGAPATWSDQGRPPTRPLIPAADLAAADAAAQAILAALVRRDRIGVGARVTISALDAVRYAAATRAGSVLAGERLAQPADHLDPANDIYQARDGRYVAIAAIEPHFWLALCRFLRLDRSLGSDAERWTWRDRRRHGDAVASMIAKACREHNSASLLGGLIATGVPAAQVASLDEAFAGGAAATDDLTPGWIPPPLPFGRPLAPAPELDDGRELLNAAETVGSARSGAPRRQAGVHATRPAWKADPGGTVEEDGEATNSRGSAH